MLSRTSINTCATCGRRFASQRPRVKTCSDACTRLLLSIKKSTSKPKTPLASVLRARRFTAGLTCGQVAENVGITKSYYQRIEQGICRPGQLTLEAIARTIGCSEDEQADLNALWYDTPVGLASADPVNRLLREARKDGY